MNAFPPHCLIEAPVGGSARGTVRLLWRNALGQLDAVRDSDSGRPAMMTRDGAHSVAEAMRRRKLGELNLSVDGGPQPPILTLKRGAGERYQWAGQ